MAYTQTDLDAIDSAIASGELEVSEGDKRVKYRSMNELQKARGFIAGQLAAIAGKRPTKQYRVNVSKGI